MDKAGVSAKIGGHDWDTIRIIFGDVHINHRMR